ncbi:aspartate kinase [Amphibacillus cookii]|uniref:aspartate kinase n=1 Tax=Amphibacillus cookii TaxID=767787 RepID=UPI00195BA030|nr:aspartate kinase [Amphibacillus cookii]MBM7540625.1 aspartate kinase [Amphibacillus cookii]
MDILVQKFGGTSVKDKETRHKAIKHIQTAKREGYKVVVVVSAIGRAPEPYATDSLLALINYPNGYQSSREQDLLLACGEIISAVVFSNELKEAGFKATALTGAQAGFITTSDFTAAKIQSMEIERLKRELAVNDVVVVAGFQGQTLDHETTTLGRGGSDTSAAALGAALDAKFIDIFTDVEGIMTADPRVVKDARTLDVVTYNEICNLAYQGAKVIHPRAVEIAMQAKVPIRVRSTAQDHIGTLITTSIHDAKGKDIPDRLITGIAHMSGITQVKIEADQQVELMHAHIFKAMADAGISVDFINIFPNGIVYTIPEVLSEKAHHLLKDLGYHPIFTHHCAKVSLVGAGMTGVPGVTATIVQSLTNVGVKILQSADSHTTIWVLINDEDLVLAINALHEAFALKDRLADNK